MILYQRLGVKAAGSEKSINNIAATLLISTSRFSVRLFLYSERADVIRSIVRCEFHIIS